MEVDQPNHKLHDYPPMIVIDLISIEQASAPAVLNVKGLKDDCHFTIAVSSEFYAKHALKVVLCSKVNLPHI